MSAAQDYYNQVLGMGHSPENALAYTRQHYPDFVLVCSTRGGARDGARLPTSRSRRSTRRSARHRRRSRGGRTDGRCACRGRPDGCTGRLCTDGRHAVARRRYDANDVGRRGLHVFALMLSMAGQFSHSWIVDNENEGSSFGLTTVRVDCSMAEGDSSVNVSKEAAVDQCKVTAYTFYAEDMEAASSENNTADDIDDVIVGDIEDVCENTYKVGAAFATGNETLMADLAESGTPASRRPLLVQPAVSFSGSVPSALCSAPSCSLPAPSVATCPPTPRSTESGPGWPPAC